MHEREEGVQRLYPGFLNPRWYYLIQLRKLIETVIQKFLKNSKNLVLADYGCGNTPYQPLLHPHVKEYIGIDLEENKRAAIHITPTGKIQMGDNEVDIVLSTQVLEHVVDPPFYLSEAKRILKSDGMLILTTHGYWMFHPDPTDYWRWTSAGLQKLISENGFEVIYFKGIIGRAAMGLQLFQDGFLFKIPKFSRPLLALFMQPLIGLFDKTTSQKSKDADACTYIVVARAKK
ncbi:class I SAM-dependent methyltransferase [Cytophagaceae bacterium DM2B3-1]|uniref:Class I SAM-dependent methyltransferase n=1 Tax=Xanthocytophaga flava TaxID=3048013 RepID=A0ABT7CRQ7_9BACT|nr:class I SAM-dependent methyltransferase [Xanthocytophaga flavus]MDJ1468596.1 class I SAM-dependent methyltransferase [Xanthocytophaga flavus]MDJ1496376.1 class I SAM-dependent methyltransferase [Xanthocytophaga flavus]